MERTESKFRMLRDDVMLYLKPEKEMRNSPIHFVDDPDNNETQWFIVHLTGPDCKHVKVGDIVLGDWRRITPPQTEFIAGEDRKIGVTSEKELLAVYTQ